MSDEDFRRSMTTRFAGSSTRGQPSDRSAALVQQTDALLAEIARAPG